MWHKVHEYVFISESGQERLFFLLCNQLLMCLCLDFSSVGCFLTVYFCCTLFVLVFLSSVIFLLYALMCDSFYSDVEVCFHRTTGR